MSKLAAPFVSGQTLAFGFNSAELPDGRLATSTYCMTLACYLYADAILNGRWHQVAGGGASESPPRGGLSPHTIRAKLRRLAGAELANIAASYWGKGLWRSPQREFGDPDTMLVVLAKQIGCFLPSKWHPRLKLEKREPLICPDPWVDQPVKFELEGVPCWGGSSEPCYAQASLVAEGQLFPSATWRLPLACLSDGPRKEIERLHAGGRVVI